MTALTRIVALHSRLHWRLHQGLRWRLRPRARGRPADRGAATLWLLASGLLVTLLGTALAGVGAAVVARHRAQAAADLGALAGAAHAVEGAPEACGRAAEIVRANGAGLVDCHLDGSDAVVTAQVRPPGAAGVLGTARATARAGPVSSWAVRPRVTARGALVELPTVGAQFSPSRPMRTNKILQDLQDIIHNMQARGRMLPLFRSPLVAELLAWLYLHPDQDYSVTDLARRHATSQATVSREADRLVAAGLVGEVRRGNLRLLRAVSDTALARPLTEILALTYGPLAVLGDALAGVGGIDEAYIYGSWAARYQGETGPVPRDIDVLVVGDADEDALFEAARVAEARLAREVNVRRVSAEGWRLPGEDPFLASVRRRPLVPIEFAPEGP